MEMQPTRASSRLRKNNSMGDLCTGIATKCKPYTLDQSKAMNKKEKACDKDCNFLYESQQQL